MDNRTIARHLRMMANLYEVASTNHPKARQYRNLANNVRTLPFALKDQLDQFQDRAKLPSDQFNSLFALIHFGVKNAFITLPLEVPHSLREILALPSIGPKATREWYQRFGITNLQELKVAIDNGLLFSTAVIPQHLLASLAQEIILLERRMTLVPLFLGQSIGHGWQEHLLKFPGITRVEWTGELRRQKALLESVALLVEISVILWEVTQQELLREGFTTSSSANDNGTMIEYSLTMAADDRQLPIRLYLTQQQDFYPAWVITSGDEDHRIYLGTDEVKSDGVHSEEEVYQAKSVAFIVPELREQGSLHKDPHSLVTYAALQGDLHMHTTYSDGANSIEDMVRGCIARGYQYMAITDHSKSAKIAHGLTVDRLTRQHDVILGLREKYPEITILHGTEVDIMTDATLDFNDEILGSLDLVVASIHTSFYLSKKEQTTRIVAAITSPHVDIIGHPTGRMLGRRDAYALDFEAIFAAATTHRVALELNSNPSRLDLDPLILRLAQEAGCLFSIDSDAHSSADLERIPAFGIGQARRGWLTPDRVINTWNWEKFSAWLQ